MKLSKKQKKSLYKIIAAAVLFFAGLIIGRAFEGKIFAVVSAACFAGAYILVGLEVLVRAVKGIIHGELLDENFLMAIATLGAFALGDLSEGVAVMLFYQVGEFFQSCAVSHSRESISSLVELRSDYALLEDGTKVDPEEVEVGDIIKILPGERIPLDCHIIEGTTSLDTSALTGESLPRAASVGDTLLSGCVNREGVVKAVVDKPYCESTVAKILDLVENAGSRKSKSENFITKFAHVYTPAVVAAALVISVLPPLLGLGSFRHWIFQGLTFLVISCPCALVISVPLAFFGGIGGASRKGILVKGGNYLEALSNLGTVVFDKTGTLTKGSFCVTEVRPNGISEKQLLTIAAMAEMSSSHPIARSIIDACRERGIEPSDTGVKYVTEVAGNGVTCYIGGETVGVGSRRLMKTLGIECETPHTAGTVVHVAATKGQHGGEKTESRYLGCIVIADEIKPTSKTAVAELKKLGVGRTVMLTGDSKAVADAVAKEIGLDSYSAELLPDGKVEELEKLIGTNPEGSTLAFVGDGLNDAPVLSRADIGIAMGGIGSDAAIEAADVVLMDDDPAKLAEAVKLARKVVLISRENVVFALGVKALILLLGLLGHANMWLAVFADVGVSVIAILNSMRTIGGKK